MGIYLCKSIDGQKDAGFISENYLHVLAYFVTILYIALG